MTVYLKTGVNQLTQAVANFHPEDRPYSSEVFKELLLEGYKFPPNVIVIGDLDLMGSLITSLPVGLVIHGDLDLSYSAITSLPVGLVVHGDLYLSHSAITSLPVGLVVHGDLYLSNTPITSLPVGLVVNGSLDLSHIPIISLPSGLFKQLLLKGCKFPPNVTVMGTLDLIYTPITSLPVGLVVHGSLYLAVCPITSLPVGLVVHGSLYLVGCPITSLPEQLVVGHDIDLSYSDITSLPVGLVVHGNLNLIGTPITSLPVGLVVHGNLNLIGTPITSLPEQLVVGRDIDLSYSNITSLPNWITTLGPRSDGGMRQIDLTGTRLSEDIINRLRAASAPGIQFHFSRAAAVPILTFSNLAEALAFWVNAANDTTLAKPNISIENDNLGDVLIFLSRLTSTAEYQNLPARPLLAKRIVETFSLIATNDVIKLRALDLIHQGLSTCDDRIISALEEIELAIRLHQIENSSHTEEELKQLGKSLLLLEMVNKKAKEFISTLSRVDEVDEVDEIEVYLAFQIGLADRLKLPVKTRNMIFRGCAHVTDAQIAAAGTNVETECTDAKLNTFLETWSPWMKHQRSLLVPAYEKLEVTDRKLEKDETCMFGGLLTQPVLYNNPVYEYAAFVKWYIDNGTDPTNREKIDLKKLKRIVIPLKA